MSSDQSSTPPPSDNSSKKPKFKYRQNPKKFPASRRWMMEAPYIKNLSPEDQAFMFTFAEAEYGGNGSILYADHEEVKRLWRENKRNSNCSMNHAVYDTPIENNAGPGNVEDTVIEMLDKHELKQLKSRANNAAAVREKERQDKAKTRPKKVFKLLKV